MRTTITTLLLLTGCTLLAQDFNLDNRDYQTISWKTFLARLDKNPKLIYFDIRTKGEQCDTSSYKSYNQGKIKGAIETDFYDFKGSYPKYLKHKKDTIYLYCSHSRRSRLLAQKLADSAFTHVVSINGGLSYLNVLSEQTIPLKKKFYQTQIKYALVSPEEFITKMNQKSAQLIDVRPDSTYYEKGKSIWENSFGRVPKSIHIPYDKMTENLNLLDSEKEIIFFDNDGSLAPIAAEKVAANSRRIGVLFFGLDHLRNSVSYKKRPFLNSKFKMLTAADFMTMKDQIPTIIDTRTPTAFQNTDSVATKNIGKLKAAINIPFSELSARTIAPYKSKTLMIYDAFMDDELFLYAQRLQSLGITDFYILAGGFWYFRWTAANTELKKELETLINP